MSGFVLTAKAKADLKEIARYTEKVWGRTQRNRYLNQLDAGFHRLAEHPERGRDCHDIRQGYRKYGIGKHLVFYRQVTPTEIEIVRVLHGSMDVEQHIPDE